MKLDEVVVHSTITVLQSLLADWAPSHIATNQFKFGQVPLRSLCASYMTGSVLVGHFKMLTIIFEVNFHFHGKLWARQLFVYKISLFLVKMQLSE